MFASTIFQKIYYLNAGKFLNYECIVQLLTMLLHKFYSFEIEINEVI